MGFPQHYGPMKYSTLFFRVEHFYIVQKISKKKVDTNFEKIHMINRNAQRVWAWAGYNNIERI